MRAIEKTLAVQIQERYNVGFFYEKCRNKDSINTPETQQMTSLSFIFLVF